MTYFGVLLCFICPPLAILLLAAWRDARRGRALPPPFAAWPGWVVLLAHVVIALIYTTPWDNYLVATRVWWYDPALVTGLTLGWVPIEEYTFFILQSLLCGLWLLFWMRRLPDLHPLSPAAGRLRWMATGALGALWLIWLGVLLSGWPAGRYMALILVWALPPIALQLIAGADILWRYRRLMLVGLLPPFLYLCLVDMLAIRSGTWVINPDAILGVYLGGILPLEEAVFFLVTTTLVVFGMTLALAEETHRRFRFPLQ